VPLKFDVTVADPTTEATSKASSATTKDKTGTTASSTASVNLVAMCCSVQYNTMHMLWPCPTFVSYV